MEHKEWMDAAACAAPEVAPEWFFPFSSADLYRPVEWQQQKRNSRHEPVAQWALAVCSRCPVLAECAADDSEPDVWSIRAGTVPSQRRSPSEGRRASGASRQRRDALTGSPPTSPPDSVGVRG